MNNIFNDPFIDHQNIIDYERKLIQNSLQQLPKPTLSSDSRYSLWTLNQKIDKLVKSKPHNLRWIGNSVDSYIYAYAYAILMLCIQNQQSFIELKKCLYQLSRKYLESSHQKFLIQFLCLIQFSNDKYSFLKKYPLVETILISLFKFIDQEKKINNSNSDINEKLQNTKKSRQNSISKFRQPAKNRSFSIQDQMIVSTEIAFIAKITQAYTTYASFFSFISMSTIDKYSFFFHLKNAPQELYIVNQGECFFLLTSKSSIRQQKKQLLDKNQVNKLLQQNLVPILQIPKMNYASTKKIQMPQQKRRQQPKITSKCYFPKVFSKITNKTDQKSLTNKIDQRDKIFSVKQFDNKKKHQLEENQIKKIESIPQDTQQGKIKQYMNIFESSGYQSQIQKIQILDQKPKIEEYLTQFKNANPHIVANKNSKEQKPKQFKLIRIKSAQSSRHHSPYDRKINRQQKMMEMSTDYKINSPFDKDSTAKKEIQQLKIAFQKAKQKRKEQILKIDQKYFQKKQEIIKKNKVNQYVQNQHMNESKQEKKKDFFSRISLKNKNDYMFGSSKNTSQFQGVGSKEIKSGKFNVYNTLSNKSQYDLRRKIFNLDQKQEEKPAKLSNQKVDLKRNKSNDEKHNKIKNQFKKIFKEDIISPESQDADKVYINVITPNGSDKIQLSSFQAAESAFMSSANTNKNNPIFQYSFGPKERAF